MAEMQELLKQQQEFTQNLLKQQQVWMQSFMQNFPGPSSSGNMDQQMVPAFHSFDKDRQNWDSYLQQLKQHFLAYTVSSPEKQKSFFLSWIGTEMFDLLKNLFGSSNLELQTFSMLTEKLTEHFKVSHHIVAARYEFFKKEMRNNQTYKEWVADLRGLARECKFICSSEACSASFVDDMIRDHIIVHTPHDAVRAASLQKQQATLADVLLIAESFESTTKTVAVIKENINDESIQVNAVTKHNLQTHKNNVKQNLFKSCSGCFVSHKRENCKFRFATCNKCGKKGHISPVCMSENINTNKRNKRNYNRRDIDIIETIFDVTGVVKNKDSKSFIQLEIFNQIVNFQMDSGASISIITLKTYRKLNRPKLIQTKRMLYGFGKKEIPVLGEIHTTVKCGGQRKNVVIVVVNTEVGDNLFGYDLFRKFGFEIQQIKTITAVSVTFSKNINDLLAKYKDIFEPALGVIKHFKANIRLKSDAQPRFFKTRQIPYAQMPQFKQEIERLINEGILKPVKFSEWASPIVLAKKPNNSIRICGDFKVAVNAQIDIEQYPLPTRDNLLHIIRNGKYFSTIDLKDAYLQMQLDDESKKIMVINTPAGLFQYQRLPYGVASAPAIFQKYVEQLLTGIEGCGNYLDDIIISAPTIEKHFELLEKILVILKSNGIKCKKEKCQFLKDNITYLGCQISSNGILPDESGVRAVKNLKPPSDIKELEAFMGKVNYYHSFVPNFSNLAAPINMLRRKGVPFKWGTAQQQAFNQLKNHIVNATQLAHFQDTLPLVLATDASPFGIGAVISHLYPDGSERPIAFASKTLDQHQVKYSQIEKEGLAIVFGVKRFHQHLYGRKFILLTDHKPLVSIFNPNKHLPTMTAHRLQRWAITLMAYQFEIKYRRTTEHGNADALSRLPFEGDDNFDKEEACFNITFENLPINIEQIRAHASKDKILREVRHFMEKGWPDHLTSEYSHLNPFFNRKNSLTIYNDLVCLQTEFIRVVIPDTLKQKTLELLHDGHWGVVKMKQLARQHIWWCNMDEDIKQLASKCEICKIENQSPPKEYQSWPAPNKPWSRVHIDFAGPIFNSMWLICVDSFSQFPYVSSMSSTTSEDTVAALSTIFSMEGIPDTIVSDNGPQLTSATFQNFCKNLGVQHITTAPFHPASNGLAERFVRTFKSSVRKNIDDNMSIKEAVFKFLSTYRFMPNVDGKSPIELIRGRPVRTVWSQLLDRKKTSQHKYATKFQQNQQVYIRYYGKGKQWIPGIIKHQMGRMLYKVSTEMGDCRRHINQIKPRLSTNSQLNSRNDLSNDYSYLSLSGELSDSVQNQPQEPSEPAAVSQEPEVRTPVDRTVNTPQQELRRSARMRKGGTTNS
ncbi:uncharacterized protein K02A2.6-like [Lucilia cuprina]|uniref:uncharacterized protein K02A2.6-like n=1 Tax=Lucilia cuprina TaxID=7375 RepID=UPI001F06EAD7|nr:uncharacterized protein K02A2.6-like [Lucilia cuprina]